MSLPERSLLRDGVAAVLLFALLLEWLRPLLDISEWSGVYRISPFVVAFALFVCTDWLRMSPWIAWPAKLLVCSGIVGYLFDPGTFPHPSWLLRYAGLTMKDFVAAADGDWTAISPDNRTMLFVLGWSMMITVIYSSVVERKQALWFVAATLLYLLGLQLWPGVNTANAIIRTVWLGFLLMGLQQFSRLESRFSLRRRTAGWPLGWLMAVPLLLSAAVAAGLWLPSEMRSGVMRPLDTGNLADTFASWSAGGARTYPSLGESAASRGAARTGYGGDDALLGGPVVPDDSVAFTATTERLTYWRGETKTFYTGRGWESGGSVDEGANPLPQRSMEQQVTIVDSSLAGRIFAGGPVERIDELVLRSGRKLSVEDDLLRVHEVYLLNDPDNRDPLRSYRLTVRVPAAPLQPDFAAGRDAHTHAADDALGGGARASDESSAPEARTVRDDSQQGPEHTDAATRPPEAGNGEETGRVAAEGRPAVGDGTSIAGLGVERDRFRAELQLPAGMPGRVKDLAEAVAYEGRDDGERAKMIEAFLKTNYTYRLDARELPKTADDFADTFLFDTMEGYCDYFSTAMVVMLRSVGIPARWVKGFAPGEVDDEGGQGRPMHVTVRNRDAHSWVEAYIAGSGWTTFDPTPGNAVVAAGTDPEAQAVFAAASLERTEPSSGTAWTDRLVGGLRGVRARLLESFGLSGSDGKGFVPWMAAGLLLLIVPTLWMVARLARGSRSPDRNGGAFSAHYGVKPGRPSHRAFDKLWRTLFRRLGRKAPSLTVREYVEGLPLADLSSREALIDFVKQYEAVRYGGLPLSSSAKRALRHLPKRVKRTKN
ncbi:DUF4129 domain-containing transglutaminase family protein [Paenibacillus hodogayensis]|uniref:DUF4129 domain-containing transglutaminase family protein n=1 Tax=Paenibacillus hodogayensis TaxID=279208 RepID=A0ABV5W6C6_9BACL